MEVRYIKDISHNYMVASAPEGKQFDYQTQMLVGNSISGLLPVHVRQVDNQLEYYYEISGVQSLEGWLKYQKLGYKEMRQLLLSLYQTVEELEKYLLCGRYLLLDESYIYIKSDVLEIRFCYYPPEKQELEESIRKLLQFMMRKVDHEKQDAVILAYGLFQESLKDNITFEELLTVVQCPSFGRVVQEEEEGQYHQDENENEKEKEQLIGSEDNFIKGEEEERAKKEEGWKWIKPEADYEESISQQQIKESSPGFQSTENPERETRRTEEKNGNFQKLKKAEKKSGIFSRFWMAVPFVTLIAVIIVFSGKLIPIQSLWRQYPGVCMAILIGILTGNFIIVKKWYFDDEPKGQDQFHKQEE